MKIIEKKKLYITLLAVAGIIALVISRLLSGAAPIHWSKKNGNIYEISSVDIIRTTVPVAPAVQKRITLKGKLNFRIYDIGEDNVRAGFQFSPVKIKIGRERHKEVEDIYSKIFFADITPEGQFTGFYFNNKIAPDDEESIISTIKSFQFIIANRASKNWDREETDRHGTYRAAYTAAEGSVSKTKKEYLEEIERGGFVNKEGRIKIKQSELSVEYGSPVSWIKNASGKDLLTFGQEGVTYLKMSSMVSLKLLPFEPDKDLAIWQDGRTPGEYISQWEKLTKNMISLALLSDRKKLEEKIGRVSPEKYINNIFSRNKRFNSNAIGELLNYLKLYPEEAARILPAILLTGELNSHQRAMLVHALGRAGHRQAQKALVKIIEDPEFAKENRIQATIVFGDIKKPEEDSINSLWEAYEGKKNSPEKDISSTSVLALGSIAGTLSRSIDQDDRANSDRIKKRIESDLNSDQDLNSKVALLHAAGNTGDNSFVKPISSFFDSNNPRVRSNAATSLTYMNDNEVDTILCKELDNESDINVKGAIVTTLYKREPTGKSVSTVIENLKNEENDIVRGEMYRYLLKNRKQPGVKDALRKMLKKEGTMENRRMITRGLSSKK